MGHRDLKTPKLLVLYGVKDFFTDEMFVVPSDAPKVNYRLPSFISKFLELQQVMWRTNAGLTDRHTFDSRPDSWPRLRRGIVCISHHIDKIYTILTNPYPELLGQRSSSDLPSWESNGLVVKHSGCILIYCCAGLPHSPR